MAPSVWCVSSSLVTLPFVMLSQRATINNRTTWNRVSLQPRRKNRHHQVRSRNELKFPNIPAPFATYHVESQWWCKTSASLQENKLKRSTSRREAHRRCFRSWLAILEIKEYLMKSWTIQHKKWLMRVIQMFYSSLTFIGSDEDLFRVQLLHLVWSVLDRTLRNVTLPLPETKLPYKVQSHLERNTQALGGTVWRQRHRWQRTFYLSQTHSHSNLTDNSACSYYSLTGD